MCRDERDCLPAVLDGVELVGTVGPSALAAVGSTDPGPAAASESEPLPPPASTGETRPGEVS